MTEQQITPSTILRSSAKTRDGSGTEYHVEAVRNDLYISAGHVVPCFLVAQMPSPGAAEAATWVELERLITEAAEQGRGTPAIAVILEQREKLQYFGQNCRSLQRHVAELTNQLEAADKMAKELIEQRDALAAGIEAAEIGISEGRIDGGEFEAALAIANKLRAAAEEAQDAEIDARAN